MTRRAALAVALAVAVAPDPARAAAADGGTFIGLHGTATMTVETFHRGPTSLDGQVVYRLAGVRFRYSMTLRSDASVSSFEESAWHTADPKDAAPFNHATITFAGDSAIADVVPGGNQRFPSVAGAVAYMNPSVAMMEQMVRRSRALQKEVAAVPVFLVNGGRTVLLTVRRVGRDSASIDLGGVEVRLAVDAAGAVSGGQIPAQHIVFVRAGYDERALATAKPDYSAPPGAAFTAEEVRVPGAGGFQLAGTLTRPRGAKLPVPALVTISGSGPEERDEALPGVRDYRPFRQIAEALARHGIAVLRLDDRGVGASGGEFRTATSQDFANDTRAALAWLRARSGIDAGRLALLGHSEGGLIAPMVAESEPRLRAIVLMAGPAQSGRRIIEYQNGRVIDVGHPSASARDSMLRDAMRQVDSLATMQPWLKFFLDYDPIATAKRVKTPVLILQGATDRQVTADQAGELEAAFGAGGNRDVTMKVFENVDHLFANDPSGDPAGYARLPERAIRADVIETLAAWLERKLK